MGNASLPAESHRPDRIGLMLPEPLDAIDTFGMPAVRAGIVRAAAANGSVTAEQLMSDLSVSRSTITYHIKPLVAAGLLVPNADPSRAGARSGFNRLIWSIDRAALDAHLKALEVELTGGPVPE